MLCIYLRFFMSYDNEVYAFRNRLCCLNTYRVLRKAFHLKKKSVFLVSISTSQFSLRQMKEECSKCLPDYLIIVCKMTYEKGICYSINWQNIVMNV